MKVSLDEVDGNVEKMIKKWLFSKINLAYNFLHNLYIHPVKGGGGG